MQTKKKKNAYIFTRRTMAYKELIESLPDNMESIWLRVFRLLFEFLELGHELVTGVLHVLMISDDSWLVVVVEWRHTADTHFVKYLLHNVLKTD